MGQIQHSTELPAAPEKVWAIIADPQTWDRWFTIHGSWLSEPPASLSAGAHLTEKVVMLGMANKIEWTVDAYEEPTTLRLSGTGMAGVKTSFSFGLKPSDTGSIISIEAEFSGAMIVGALGKAVEKDSGKQLEASLAKLTELAA
ncbi:SRPBCC family protein [Streptomyces sp. NPDC058401]|uniref:type II toxin-antitoxin system Rv0910 family toxin n=1 Tax=Streptomyces sp. NPDC058401 TaxID=3346480 RepID=UPI0036639CC6